MCTGPQRVTGTASITAPAAMVAAIGRLARNTPAALLGAAAHLALECRSMKQGGARQSGVDASTAEAAYAAAAVVLSVAALEAAINQVYLRARECQGGGCSDMSPEAAGRIAEGWTDIEARRTLWKYQEALRRGCRPVMDAGARPFQEVALVIRLRNALVHAKDEWESPDPPGEISGPSQLSKLESALRGHFEFPKAGEQGPGFFLDRCLCAACAEWSVGYTDAFIRAFYEQFGWEPPEWLRWGIGAK